ncbi:MAG: imidazole glycerol phosphate synthase subunit HisH [Nitrospirota bacterium]
MIAIIDYQVVNLRSIQKAFERLGATVDVTSDPERIRRAERVVLPGVGAFKAGMDQLQRLGLVPVIHEVIDAGTPLLGVCLGMQLLMTESEEFGVHRGLNVIPGKVVRFPGDAAAMKGLKVPHMGWNAVSMRRRPEPLTEIPDRGYFYFVHSYYVAPENPAVVAAETVYGVRFPSILAWRNVVACQFHPEKSQALGLSLLRRFASFRPVATGAAL